MAPDTVARPAKSLRRRILVGLSVSAGTLLVLAVALEIGVRLFVSEETFRPLANIYAAHEASSIRYTLKPHYTGHAFGVPLRANTHGFRGPDWQREKPEGVFRIAFIGDSHAFAYGVPVDEGIGEQLQSILNAAPPEGRTYEVLNFALPGYNSHQQQAVFEKIALGFDPDLVVVCFCSNDDDPAFFCDADGFLRRPSDEDPDGKSILDWRERGFLDFERSAMAHSKFLLYVRILWMRFRQTQGHEESVARMKPTSPLVSTESELARLTISKELEAAVYEPLSGIAATCKQRRLPVAFLCYGSNAWILILRRLAAEFSVPTLLVGSMFPDVPNYPELLKRFSLGWDSHFNGEAHRRLANGLADLLVENELIGK